MLGVLVNTLAVLAGSSAGLLFRRGIPEKLRNAAMLAIGLCTLLIGVQGALKGENTLVAIISMTLGAIAGTLLDIDGRIGRLAAWSGRALKGRGGAPAVLAQGMVTAFLLWCVGAMTIVGSIQAGVSGEYGMLYTKSVLDLISSIMLASSLGAGVLLAAPLLFVTESALVLLSGLIGPALSAAAINEITCVGSLAVIALGLDLVGVAKIKAADFLPAILLAPAVSALLALLPI